jgi:hypothetical protein
MLKEVYFSRQQAIFERYICRNEPRSDFHNHGVARRYNFINAILQVFYS